MQKKFWYLLLTMTALFMGLIWTVTNIGYDATYQISMGYRLVKGDTMLLEMWEPHQMSAFLCAFFIKIYMALTHTTTGVVLFLQVMGILIRGGISLLFYRTLKDVCKKQIAFLMAFWFFMISPKDYALPEFSNMQVWFGALLTICMVQYEKKKKLLYLVGAGLSLCLAVLSYPSALVLYPICLALLFCRDRKTCLKPILLLTGVCAAVGLVYTGFLLKGVGSLDTFLICINGMFSLEPSHTVGPFDKVLRYCLDLVKMLPLYLAAFGIGRVVRKAAVKVLGIEESREQTLAGFTEVVAGLGFLAAFLVNILMVRNRYGYGAILLAVILLGLFRQEKIQSSGNQGEEDLRRAVYRTGTWLGLGCMFATLLMTDLPFVTTVPYGLVAFIFALIPLSGWYESLDNGKIKKWLCFCGCGFAALIVFRGIYIRTPIEGRDQIISITEDMSIVRHGPAFGIITDEMSSAKERDNVADYQRYVAPGSKVWIVDGVVNTLGYLYVDTEVAAPTVMSTPTYREELLQYWELNPDKLPDVIITSAYGGEISFDMAANEWFMDWLENTYCPSTYVDGTFCRFYFR